MSRKPSSSIAKRMANFQSAEDRQIVSNFLSEFKSEVASNFESAAPSVTSSTPASRKVSTGPEREIVATLLNDLKFEFETSHAILTTTVTETPEIDLKKSIDSTDDSSVLPPFDGDDLDQAKEISIEAEPIERKSSYSSLNGAPPSVAANNQLQQQQRRCSNGSSGSSGQSSSTNIYATSNGNVNGYHPQSAAPQGPAPVPQSNGVTRIPVPPPAPPPLTPAASASVSKGAPISSNAPPPPPPPPGNLFKSGGPKGAPSMADELKAKQNRLRKVSSATDTQAASASTSTPTPKVSISGGGGNALMDELSRRLEMNKAQANNKADAVSTSSSSGFSSSSVGAATTSDTSDSGATLTSTRRPNGDAPKPWSKTNGISSNNVSTDSPKALRKTNGTTDTNVGITTADLERLKIEILAEVTQQINAAKQEILNAILAQR
uniref:WH1 domain-containing protein n=1 Tax=Panagrellus redivivus TaxID=6233 RepID=A0A7E4W767_PANRE